MQITHMQKKKKNCKGFEVKNLSEYQDLYFQSDTLLLVYVFEKFSYCTRISTANNLKKTKNKVRSIK